MTLMRSCEGLKYQSDTSRFRNKGLEQERRTIIKDSLSTGLCKANPLFMRAQCCQPNQHAAQHAARQAADLAAISAF